FDALKPVAVEEPADDGEGTVWRCRKVPPSARKSVPEGVATPPADARPSWLDRDLGAEAPAARLGSPSSAYDAAAAAGAFARGLAAGDRARARGVLIHRLLQALRDIPDAARAEAARRHLAQAADAFSADEQDMMLKQVRVVLDDPRFAQLFLPGS